jgi:uncharacterized membrane protein
VALSTPGTVSEGGPGIPTLPPTLVNAISWTLRIGVALSAALAIVGTGVLLAGPASAFTTVGSQGTPFSGPGFLAGLASGNGVDILFLALLTLIATPLLRVVISVAMFASIGDRRFVALTVSVLLLLGASVVVGAVT